MTATRLLPGSTSAGWYLGVVVLYVVRGARVLDQLMYSILHVLTFLEEWIILAFSCFVGLY
jgi:hypothetical protein